MTIVFLCGCLQPGRDGVGDYTRRLAVELIRQENQVTVIALNDQSVNKVTSVEQTEGAIALKVLQLPSSMEEKNRFDHAKKWIDSTNPDLLSLQFVPFSFHPKGLSSTLNSYLRTLGEGKQWHIMFHELWVGIEKKLDFEAQTVGVFQKKLIQKLIKNLNPVLICTQSHVYLFQLKQLTDNVVLLPLFSNIQVANQGNMVREGSNPLKRLNKLQFVIFGGIHPGASINAFAKEVALFKSETKKPVCLTFIGRSGNEYELWKTIWEAEGLNVEFWGEQPADKISDILSTSTIGLTTTPVALAEKSGSVAAMHAHGLNVLSIAKSGHPKDNLPGVTQYKEGDLKAFLSTEMKSPVWYSVADVAKQFITIIERN